MKKLELRMSISMLISRFYYEKSALGEKSRIWNGDEAAKRQLCYEKREKMHVSRNRIHRYNKNKDSLPIYLRSESLFFVC